MFKFLENIGTTELLIILVAILILVGGKKLSDLARGMGESKKEMEKIRADLHTDDAKGNDEEES